MGITGQVRQHGLGTGERPLAVDDPLDLAQVLEPVGKGGGIAAVDAAYAAPPTTTAMTTVSTLKSVDLLCTQGVRGQWSAA